MHSSPHATSSNGPAAGLKAVILAGGKGTRLRPFTVNFPKPLVPLGEVPVVEVLIERLLASGITDITLTLGHLAELVRAYFANRPSLTDRMNLRFVEEIAPTGTAGSLAIVPGIDDTFLVMNGDLLTNLDFHDLVRFHREREAELTIASFPRRTRLELGVIEFDDRGRLVDYVEKPEQVHHVSMGIYVYEPSALEFLEPGRRKDLPDLALEMRDAGRRVCVYEAECEWLDIGNPEDYAQAQAFVERPFRE